MQQGPRERLIGTELRVGSGEKVQWRGPLKERGLKLVVMMGSVEGLLGEAPSYLFGPQYRFQQISQRVEHLVILKMYQRY